jgi:hypothetical protein
MTARSSAKPGAAVFELERFEWASPERLELEGRWFDLRARRFIRPTLVLEDEHGRHRLLALLEHKPWDASNGETWIAAFAWDGEPSAYKSAELAVAPGIDLSLPAPKEAAEAGKPRRRRAQRIVSRDADREAAALAVLPEPAEGTPAPREATASEQAVVQSWASELLEAQDRAVAAEARADQEAARAAELASQHDALVADRDAAVVERDGAVAERDAAVAERDAAIAERRKLERARDAAIAEHSRLKVESGGASAENNKLEAERDRAVAERDRAVADRDRAMAERQRIATVPHITPHFSWSDAAQSSLAVWTPRLLALAIFIVLVAVVAVLLRGG